MTCLPATASSPQPRHVAPGPVLTPVPRCQVTRGRWERSRFQLDRIRGQLGPRPEPALAEELGLWAAALLNPLPPLGIVPELRLQALSQRVRRPCLPRESRSHRLARCPAGLARSPLSAAGCRRDVAPPPARPTRPARRPPWSSAGCSDRRCRRGAGWAAGARLLRSRAGRRLLHCNHAAFWLLVGGSPYLGARGLCCRSDSPPANHIHVGRTRFPPPPSCRCALGCAAPLPLGCGGLNLICGRVRGCVGCAL